MPPAKRGAGAKRGTPQRTRARQGGGRAASERPSVTVEMEDLTNFNESKNVLIYSDPGIGKTVAAGGIATAKRKAAFMTTEKGVISAKRTGSRAKLMRALDWDHIEAALDTADRELGPDDWLIPDSVTRMQVLLLRNLLEVGHETRDADLDMPQLQDYPKWHNMMQRFIDRMVDAPYNTLFVATAMHAEDADGDTLILPNLQANNKDPLRMANYLCAQMDCVFYLGIPKNQKGDKPLRRILTEAHPPYFAKNRYSGTLPKRVDFEEGEYDIMDWVLTQLDNDPEA